MFLTEFAASSLFEITIAPKVPLLLAVDNEVVPTPTAFTNPVTVPESPGPISVIGFEVIVLSVFLVY